jgi:hypothetical protein
LYFESTRRTLYATRSSSRSSTKRSTFAAQRDWYRRTRDRDREKRNAAAKATYEANRERILERQRRRRAERKLRERLAALGALAEREREAREAAYAAAAEFRAAVLEARAGGATLREIGDASGRSFGRIAEIVNGVTGADNAGADGRRRTRRRR